MNPVSRLGRAGMIVGPVYGPGGINFLHFVTTEVREAFSFAGPVTQIVGHLSEQVVAFESQVAGSLLLDRVPAAARQFKAKTDPAVLGVEDNDMRIVWINRDGLCGWLNLRRQSYLTAESIYLRESGHGVRQRQQTRFKATIEFFFGLQRELLCFGFARSGGRRDSHLYLNVGGLGHRYTLDFQSEVIGFRNEFDPSDGVGPNRKEPRQSTALHAVDRTDVVFDFPQKRFGCGG